MTGTYSFLDVQVDMVGPTGSVSLSEGAIADEGITITPKGERNTHVTGANGPGMHSLRASRAGTVTVRVLKTGALNAVLSTMFNAQTVTSALHGRNTFTISNPVSGDTITCVNCAFQKMPDIAYATEGNVNDWVFDADQIYYKLGAGAQY